MLHDATPDSVEEIRLLQAGFIEGFRSASDKLVFLRLAKVPLELPGPPGLKLIEIRVLDRTAVGAASRGFATDELVYHPLPKSMVKAAADLTLVYVSSRGVVEKTLAEVLAQHDHHHHH